MSLKTITVGYPATPYISEMSLAAGFVASIFSKTASDVGKCVFYWIRERERERERVTFTFTFKEVVGDTRIPENARSEMGKSNKTRCSLTQQYNMHLTLQKGNE